MQVIHREIILLDIYVLNICSRHYDATTHVLQHTKIIQMSIVASTPTMRTIIQARV